MSRDLIQRMRDIMQEAYPHIGDEYQRSWPNDEEFDAMVSLFQSLITEANTYLSNTFAEMIKQQNGEG